MQRTVDVALPLSHSVVDPTLRADLARLEDASDVAASGGKWAEVDSLDRLVQSVYEEAIRVTQQAAAVDNQIERCDAIGDWALAIDDEWPELTPGAERAYDHVVAAWRGGVGENDGPAATACYARALFVAVQDVADGIASYLQSDPRTNGCLHTALRVPKSLAT